MKTTASTILESIAGMSQSLEGIEPGQPGWHARSGWNSALLHVTDVLRSTLPSCAQDNPKLLTDTEQGALMAVSILISIHDQPSMAADVVNELGLAHADCSQLDDFDKQNLKKIQGERGVRLHGI